MGKRVSILMTVDRREINAGLMMYIKYEINWDIILDRTQK